MDQQLKIVVEDHPDETRVKLTGQVAKLEVYRFRTALECLIEDRHYNLIVDMSEVTFIDSAGIGALVKARGAAVKLGGSVKAIPPVSPNARRVLEFASIGKIIPLLEPVERETVGAPSGPELLRVSEDGTSFDPQRLIIQIQDLATRIEGLEGRLAAIEDRMRTMAPR